MKKFLKWTGIIVLVILLIASVSAYFLINNFNKRAEKKYDITAENIIIPTDTLSIARGKDLALICSDCHSSDLGGKLFFDDPTMGTIYSSNLTSGEGGAGSHYDDQDWVLAIRHGVNYEGKPMFIMPSHDYMHFSEQDLACLIAYLKQIPAVNREKKPTSLKPLTKVIAAIGGFGDVFSVETIKHDAPFEIAPERNTSSTYGQYLVKVSGCKTCHQPNLAGGKSPDPNSPPVPNITKAGNIGNWSANDFIQSMKTGLTPEGKKLDKVFMPYLFIGAMSDNDQTAIYNYLLAIPAAQPK